MKFETNYEKLAIALSTLLLLLVCGTGFWVYYRLSSVADKIVTNSPKDSRLIILKGLSNDLVSAENEAYSFAFRAEDAVLKEFYLLANRSSFKLKQLENIPSKDPSYKRHIDSLGTIVAQRFETLEQIVLVQNSNRVDEAMEKVIDEVSSMSKSSRKRLFPRRNKEGQYETGRTNSTVSTAAISKELSSIQKDVVLQELSTNAKRLELEQKNNFLTARYTLLVQTIENREKKVILAEANEAKDAAEETNVVIGIFCVTSILLIVIAGYLIVELLKKTRRTNRQLRIAKNRSDQLTESKSRFLANMSHELRTPLNAIVGFSDQLNQQRLNVEQQEKLDIIRKAAAHLTEITDQILDFSKIQAGAVQLEEIQIDLKEEIGFVEQSVQQLAQVNSNTLKIQLDESLPPLLTGDPLRLRQVLMNLLSNAMKFTYEGEIKLSVKANLQSNDEVTLAFEISDTGIGISKENLARIFDEFEQAEIHTTRNYGGTGLGLSITKMLVERMGGALRVTSKLQHGTTFHLSIPFGISHEKKKDKLADADVQLDFLAGKNILLVDDESYNRKLLRAILQPWNVKITEAVNGKEALKEMNAADYDLILLDLRMPEMDGFQAKRAMKKLAPKKANTPVIALTAALSAEERAKMLEEGWQGVLLKPLKLPELADCLRPLFNSGETKIGDKVVNTPNESETAPIAMDADNVSLESLKTISNNDMDFYHDMIVTLHRTTTEGIDEINRAAKAGEWVAMADAAHKIASPVRHIQAYATYELLKELEKLGRAGNLKEDPHTHIEQLNQSIAKILLLLSREIEERGVKN